MSRFYSKLRDTLRETELRKVRVIHMDGYTGYILEEDGEGALVYVVSGDDPEQLNQLINLQPDQYEEIIDEPMTISPLETVKELGLRYLMQKGLLTCRDVDKITEFMELPCIHTVDKFLRNMNITDTEILNLIKPAII